MAGQSLRHELVDAIEALNPGQDVPFRAPHARLYNVLTLHYLERMTLHEAGYELGVSSRQVQRNLRQGEKNVAAVVWARRAMSSQDASNAVQLSSLQAEMERLDIPPRSTDVYQLVQRAQDAVSPLARQKQVILCGPALQDPMTLPTVPLLAEQVLISALTHAVRQARPGQLALTLSAGKDRAMLALCYVPDPAMDDIPAVNPAADQLAERLGWQIERKEDPSGGRVVRLQMVAQCPTVLIIDDNQGLVDLLKRYLTDQACQVVGAANGQEGLQLALKLQPQAIVLDVMMPQMPGWEVLQRLQGDPRTADVPVIVCSVIAEPELALALGAAAFLPKPVRQYDVLGALRSLGVV
jgi:CheY-like chemotaxis protein